MNIDISEINNYIRELINHYNKAMLVEFLRDLPYTLMEADAIDNVLLTV